jgi:hypothetical protein
MRGDTHRWLMHARAVTVITSTPVLFEIILILEDLPAARLARCLPDIACRF